ncbi:MAG: Jag N-terminal domain-containing protein [Candidatus Hydrogenedentes bacterium]|nr:Jag N-terminal domain-containing protein [Candidatus Hydrogenedentota bacterium]
MKVIESSGKTREEAIQNGLKELGVDMHDIEKIDVVDEGSKGFLGFGARPVRVRLEAEQVEETPRRSENRRGGNRQERQGQRGNARNDRKQGQRDGRREPRGGRQEKRQNNRGADDKPKDRDEGSKSSERQEGQRRKNSRRRPGGQDNRGDRNTENNQGAGQNRKKQGNAHKTAPVTDKKTKSVTDEATEALRRAENFENNVDDGKKIVHNELPPNARPEEEIETITDEQGKEAAAMLSETLELMELNGDVSFTRSEDGSARLTIESEDDGGILIGKRGVTLHAIQYLVNRMIAQNEAADNTERAIVDVGGYVDRRYNTLADMAKNMARRAKDSGRNVRLKPLSPQERRIIHLTLEPDPAVRTYSLGDSLFRSIVINPVDGRSDEPNRRRRGNRDRNRNAGAAPTND